MTVVSYPVIDWSTTSKFGLTHHLFPKTGAWYFWPIPTPVFGWGAKGIARDLFQDHKK